MEQAFYHPLGGDRFAADQCTAGPWSPDSQHMGPPTALLGRAFEAVPANRPSMIARVTVEILGPVPVAELAVHAELERPGRSVELLRGEISANGRTVLRGSAWRIVRSDSAAVQAGVGDPLPPPAQGTPMGRPDSWGPGYLDVMQWRTLHGSLDTSGPATVWARQGVALVDGEQPTGLQRLLAVADSGNGVSSRLNPNEWWFINTELTVHLHRDPTGEWMGLDANTVIGPNGVGSAFSTLHDEHGPVGRGAQALMVRPRQAGDSARG